MTKKIVNFTKMASLCILLSLCYDDEFKAKISDETYGPIPRDARLTPTGNPLDVLDTRMKASPGPDPLWFVYENSLQSRSTIDKLKERQNDLDELFASPAPDADVQFTNDAFGGQNWEEYPFKARDDWERGIPDALPVIVETLNSQNVLASNLVDNLAKLYKRAIKRVDARLAEEKKWQMLAYLVTKTNALEETLKRDNQFETQTYLESVDGPCALLVFVFAFTFGLLFRFSCISCKKVTLAQREPEKIISV
ncbi:MAG: hypothetical protein CBC12_07240 [Candidatus Puniceispirillum sp. TMED52]|nr:MAG: hypothetical protein CBC12_07240 [Candidatus Puniceispirillum sp. TMED52]RPF82002.1 MAG: hypothetical protein CBC65_001320 [Rhodothermaceae bacterium TMED105]